MNQYFRSIGALFLLSLLALGAGLLSGHRLGQHAAAVLQSDSKARHSSIDVQTLFLPTGSEQAGGSFLSHKWNSISGKYFPKGISGIRQIAEALINSVLTQYNKEADAFPVRLRKADLIFPFHYFR